MDNACICNEKIERLGEYVKPTRLCPVHGDPILLILVDEIDELGQQIRELQSLMGV